MLVLTFFLSAALTASALQMHRDNNRQDNSLKHPVPPNSLKGSHGIYYNSRPLPHNKLVSDLLNVGDEERYFFIVITNNTKKVIAAVMPCSAPMEWEIRYRPFGTNISENNGATKNEEKLSSYQTHELEAYHEDNPRQGIYILQVKAIGEKGKTYVKFFVSTTHTVDPEFWETYNRSQFRIKEKEISKRRRYRELTLRWKPSPIRSHEMRYCILLNTERHYKTMCQAQGEQFGIPYLRNMTTVPPQQRKKTETVIGCVGRKTKYIAPIGHPLEYNKETYFIDLFVMDMTTNISYPYGRLTYHPGAPKKLPQLKDGKQMVTKLRRQETCRAFEFNMKKYSKKLYIDTVVCSETAYMNVTGPEGVLVPKNPLKVYNQDYIILTNTTAGIYKVSVCGEFYAKTQKIKVTAATKKRKLKYPVLPSNTTVKVLENTLNCNTVSIAWMPSPDKKSQRYCVLGWRVTNVTSQDPQDIYPSRCMESKGSKKNPKGPLMYYCLKNKNKSMVTNPIGVLEPGTKYRILVRVYRKRKVHPLDYKPLYFETPPYCLPARDYGYLRNFKRE